MAEINGETFPKKCKCSRKRRRRRSRQTRPREHCVLKRKWACLLPHEADCRQRDKKPPGFLVRVFLPMKDVVPNLPQAEGGLESGTASEEGTSPISTLGSPRRRKAGKSFSGPVQKQGQGALVRTHFPPQVSILQGCTAGLEQCPRPLPLSEWHC